MINPDEIPVWLGVPVAISLWACWALLTVRDTRRTRRRR